MKAHFKVALGPNVAAVAADRPTTPSGSLRDNWVNTGIRDWLTDSFRAPVEKTAAAPDVMQESS